MGRELVISLIAGIAVGVLTGLIPGLHLNTFLPLLWFYPNLTSFVVGVVVTHSFFDFIPSILLGVPDEASSLAVLPGHRMVLKGRALQAFKLTVVGGVLSTAILFFTLPLLLFFSFAYSNDIVVFILLFIVFSLLFENNSKLLFIVIFTLSAALGLLIGNDNTMLLPMLTGFFGASTLIFSLMTVRKIPVQSSEVKISISTKAVSLATIGGVVCGLIPGITSSIAGSFLKNFFKHNDENTMLLLGGINTVYSITAILAIFLIGRARSGAAILLRTFNPDLLEVVAFVLLATGISAIAAWKASDVIIPRISSININLLNIFSLGFTLLLVHVFTGFNGIIILVTATSIGLMCLLKKSSRAACMACLIVPVLIYYL